MHVESHNHIFDLHMPIMQKFNTHNEPSMLYKTAEELKNNSIGNIHKNFNKVEFQFMTHHKNIQQIFKFER